jgi:phage gp36-like protein
MAYCATADLIAAISHDKVVAYSDDGSTGAINVANVARAISDADAIIDGYLRTRYTVPLEATVPAIIASISVDLAVFSLWQRRYPDKLSETMKERRANAVRILERIASGTITLPITLTQAEAVATTIRVSERTRLFDNLDQY